MDWKIVGVLIVATISLTNSISDNPCLQAKDCSSCLKANGDCYWCTDDDFTSGKNAQRARCNKQVILQTDQKCKTIDIKDGSVKTVEDAPFGSTVQVRPQKVTLELRPAQTKEVIVSVQPAKDFPVKLYYLMDMSRSMYDDLQKLQTLGQDIATEIGKITKNHYLAFGTFVDKTVQPFIQPELLDKPCTITKDDGTNSSCMKTFSYRHIFDFNRNAKLFEAEVSKQAISGNLDTPEGGFDGLMQLAVCPTKLGWGNIKEFRRLAVFVTDASPHIAGDGKIGGITQPNDETCHLQDESGYQSYTMADKLDYPSISALKAKLKASKIVPIFAVTKDVRETYQKLKEEWKDIMAKAGDLDQDSANVVKLIGDAYKEIVTTARLTDNAPDGIVVRYKVKSGCPKKVTDEECTDMETEKPVEFIADVTALDCPADWNVTDRIFQISVPGFGDVDITVKMICECGCATDPTKIEKNSPKCNSTGDFKCGICDCPEGRFGTQCQCDSAKQSDQSLCRQNTTKGELEAVCSGQGQCICGECVCNTRSSANEEISGRFCECNNWNCPRYLGKLCGGPERGVCDCGRCKCKEAFLGENCGEANCTIGARNCVAPKDGKICSGNGVCDCDRCICETGYKGTHCENCVSCASKCKDNKDCVLCQVFNEPSKEECDKRIPKCDLNIDVVKNDTNQQCSFADDKQCFVHFSFYQNGTNANETVRVREEKICVLVLTTGPNILAIVLGTIGGIVLLCLILLLLWKLLITAYDNYEYHKFEKDRMKSKWENAENPIYRPSKQQFQNPTFAGTK